MEPTKKTTTKQDTGKFRKNTKDQFYTNVSVAISCIQCLITKLPYTTDYVWIEPSAGNGSFFHNIPSTIEKIGFDLEPMAHDIQQQDYLLWEPPPLLKNKKIVVIGNPPFGRQSSLAKSFITKSCEFATIIAFILPKSFVKPSMFRVFDFKFHQICSIELDKNAFVINGSPHDVPCVFQIWQKMDTNREMDVKAEPCGFTYVKLTTGGGNISQYHIAFRRVGGLAGKCYIYATPENEFNFQTHYFIRFDDNVVPYMNPIIEKINSTVFPSNTVGPRSISKPEANVVINHIISTVMI
jgi:hypothetical protein